MFPIVRSRCLVRVCVVVEMLRAVETAAVGTYDDMILLKVDQLKVECAARGLRLIIALHDRCAHRLSMLICLFLSSPAILSATGRLTHTPRSGYQPGQV